MNDLEHYFDIQYDFFNIMLLQQYLKPFRK
jgi:hypothetical protein